MITLNGNHDGALIVRGPTPADVDFTIVANVNDQVISGGSTSETTIDDVHGIFNSAGTVDHNKSLQVTNLTSKSLGRITFESEDETIGTVDENGVVERVSNGDVRILVRVPNLTKAITVSLSRTVGGAQILQTFMNFVEGSLALAITNRIDTAITGLTPSSTTLNICSTLDHGSATYIRNESLWLQSVDLSWVPVWNSANTKYLGGLVSPRHMIAAAHVGNYVGRVMRFAKADGTVVTRTVSSQQIAAGDCLVLKLDADVPDGIGFARVPPADYRDYLKGLSNKVPCCTTNQANQLNIANYLSDSISTANAFWPPNPSLRYGWQRQIIDGDSGCPLFIVVNNTPVIITTWHSTLGGTSVHSNRANINSAMTTLGGGYQLTDIDLSGFPNYGD